MIGKKRTEQDNSVFAEPSRPTQQEVFGSGNDAAAAAFALLLSSAGLKDNRKHWLWVQDRESLQLNGRPFVHGLPELLRSGLIHIAARTAEDALFALEEGVRCDDFACVVGELAGASRAVDFTASRRLSVASESHGTPLVLSRLNATADLSSARRRWHVKATPSSSNTWNAHAPGLARWRADLFRARDISPPFIKWTKTMAGSEKRASPRRILSIWLPQLALDQWAAQAADDALAQPLALIRNSADGPRIVAVNALARKAGIVAGTRVADARGLCPALTVLAHDADGDRACLDQLALWAQRLGADHSN